MENRYSIRKLNQAYFAFYGTYADTAASVSPIGEQLVRFRSFMPDVGTFVRTVSGVSSYDEFLELLSELEKEGNLAIKWKSHLALIDATHSSRNLSFAF